MRMILLSILLVTFPFQLILGNNDNSSTFPYCVNMEYDNNGFVNVGQMLYDCSGNLQGALLPPSMFSYHGSRFEPTLINLTIAVNTLIVVDDVNTQVTLDLWFRQYWEDDRWLFPDEMWQSLNPAVYREGMEISPYVRNSNPLNLWLPDTYIIEAVQANVVSELIHLFPNGTIFWSRHFLVTLTEPTMDLHNYPEDTQSFKMTIQSFAYSSDYVKLSFIEPIGGIFFSKDNNGQTYANENQMWDLKSFGAYVSNDGSGIFFDRRRHYSTVYLHMDFDRQSFGIVYRLALPITIFLFIVGFSFWAEEDKRIDITVTMLLVISALYLVIGQVIPFVGYYTTLDMYITAAFMLLAATSAIHFIILEFRRKQDKYPLLELISLYIVYFFRIFWLPFAFLMFILFFHATDRYIIIPFILVTVGSVGNGLLHYDQFIKIYNNTITNLQKKHENSEFRVSAAEGLVIAAGVVKVPNINEEYSLKNGKHRNKSIIDGYLRNLQREKENETKDSTRDSDDDENYIFDLV